MTQRLENAIHYLQELQSGRLHATVFERGIAAKQLSVLKEAESNDKVMADKIAEMMGLYEEFDEAG